MEQLQQAVSSALANVIAAGAIEQAIEAQIKKTITSVLESELARYSDFGKGLEEYVKAALQVDFRNLEIPGYNDLILKIVRQSVDMHVNNQLASQVEQQMQELLAPAPAEIKLSALVAEFIDEQSRELGCSCDRPNRITLIVCQDRPSSGFHHIYFDKDEGTNSYDCPYQIDVHEGRVYSVAIEKRDSAKTMFFGPMWGFKRRLFQLYAAGSKLIVDGDENSIDTRYPGRGY